MVGAGRNHDAKHVINRVPDKQLMQPQYLINRVLAPEKRFVPPLQARFLSYLASYDVAGIVWQVHLPGGCVGVPPSCPGPAASKQGRVRVSAQREPFCGVLSPKATQLSPQNVLRLS